MQKIKKPVSILLVFMMIVSLFAAVPMTVNAAPPGGDGPGGIGTEIEIGSGAVGDFVPESDYLTFTAVEAGASVTLKYTGGTLQYNINNSGWQSYTVGSLIALAKGDSVSFRGKNTAFSASNHVSIDGKVACSGNVMSLRLDDDGMDQGLSTSCFSNMFSGCTGLTAAPELPETTLAGYCYSNMFSGCTNLTVAPALPATTLVTSCYSEMFAGCTSLTKAPELPATTLAPMCYQRMFYVCTSLTTAPELPATELVYGCYGYMFAGCSSIKLSETETAEYSIPYSVPSGGDATPASPTTLKNMFAGTGGTFTGTPEINKTYYLYREVPKYTVTWKNGDTTLETDTDVAEGTTPTYDGATPEKASDTYYDYTFAGWSPAIAPVSADVTYTAQFTATAKTFKVNVKKLTGGTFTIENLTGETTVAQLKEIIADQINIPATAQRLVFAGKNLEDAKTLAECNIQKESTIHLVLRGYTVTWLNYDNSELGTSTVQYGATPTYDGETPTKPEDEQNTYTFAGWTPEVTAVTGVATYKATFTATKKPISSTDLYEGLVLDKDNTIKFIIVKSGENWRRIDLSVYLDGTLVKELYTQDVSTTEPDRYYTTTKKCIVDSYEFSYGDPVRHVLYLKSVYDVTWKNDDGTELEKDENVVVGTTPTYNGEVPTKAEDETNTYTFAGWTPAVAPVTGDVTYTATFTPVSKALFTGHSVTLGGDVGVNFFLNPAVLDTYTGTKTVKFTVDGKETTVDVPATATDNGYMVTCNVVAAQMAHKIKAVVYADGTALDQTDSYSVQDYAEAVCKDSDQPDDLKALAAAMLHYGAEAQTVFAEALKEHPDRADKNVGAADYSGVTVDDVLAAIKGEASDLNDVAEKLDAKYFTNSLIYMQNNTLRIYFTPTTYPATMPNAGAYDGNLSDYYYYKDVKGIAAAELDDQQDFTVGNVSFKYSPLNYVVNVLNSNMSPAQKDLAKALFLYNQAANEFFDEPAPAQNVVDLGALTGDYEAQNNDVLTGTLAGQYKITIADGATVTLKDATITCLSSSTTYDGIALLGDATILLEGENTVKGGYKYNAGIFVPENKTLTIDGTGSLNVSSGGSVAAIGAKRSGMVNGTPGGNIVINGGTINANGGNGGAGIGGCTFANCGTITITGGNITAVGNDNAPGIGSGNSDSFCASITINGGTVTATGDRYAAGIGSGWHSNCGDITIAGTVTQVTATKGYSAPNSIGAGKSGTCGTISIADPSKVTQN